MSSHPRDDSSGVKQVVQVRKIDSYEFVEEELAARNICSRKHGCHVLLSVPDAFTYPICQSTISFLAGHDLYIPSEVEHARWYLEVFLNAYCRAFNAQKVPTPSLNPFAGHLSMHVKAQ
jgi:hypothetical protein